ncbi:MAG: signal peptidase I [Candidatus Woesearchaeota archaeon]
MQLKELLKKTWNFIWHDDSLLSWIVNVILAFILVKFIIYPGFGLLLTTNYPIVAVVSGSMEHNTNFDNWWDLNSQFYENIGFTKSQFENLPFHNGFNKGDIMILKGVKPKNIKSGDILVYQLEIYPNPIIHRVIKISQKDFMYTFITKGDNNQAPDPIEIKEQQIKNTGKAIIKIPYLGWVKILFTNIIGVIK